MSELSIFKNGAAIPAHLRRTELSETTKALMGSTSSRRISIKGGIFRLIVGGQEIAKNEDRSMNIIIAAAAPKTSRQYYEATYQDAIATAPSCYSNNGETPDTSCEKPQSSACLTCPQNIAGSGQGQSRACRYSHRLAVLLENDIASGEIYELSLASTSLFGKGTDKMPLMQYVQLLAANGLNVTDVVTELRFDTDSATPKMVFRAVRYLEIDELESVVEHSNSPEAKLAITMSFSPAKPKEELVFVQPTTKPVAAVAAPVAPVVEEPKVRESKKPTPAPMPTSIDDVLAEWGD